MTQPPPVIVDATQRTAVAVCTRCPWRAIRLSRGAVLAAAADHQLLAHDDHRTAQQLRWRAQLAAATRR